MEQDRIDKLGLSIAMGAASQTKTTIGLLDAEISGGELYNVHSAHRARLDEIERRILQIEALLQTTSGG